MATAPFNDPLKVHMFPFPTWHREQSLLISSYRSVKRETHNKLFFCVLSSCLQVPLTLRYFLWKSHAWCQLFFCSEILDKASSFCIKMNWIPGTSVYDGCLMKRRRCKCRDTIFLLIYALSWRPLNRLKHNDPSQISVKKLLKIKRKLSNRLRGC